MTVLLFSGGVDSTVALWELLSKGVQVRCLGIHYGQRHERELRAAGRIAKDRGVPYEVVYINPIDVTDASLFGANALTDMDVALPEGKDQSATVVPNRNMILLSLAGAYALSHGDDVVAYGAHLGDRETYADCRREWVGAMREVLGYMGLDLQAPLLGMSKAQVIERGRELRIPFHKTWSCYAGGDSACGRCGACKANGTIRAASGWAFANYCHYCNAPLGESTRAWRYTEDKSRGLRPMCDVSCR